MMMELMTATRSRQPTEPMQVMEAMKLTEMILGTADIGRANFNVGEGMEAMKAPEAILGIWPMEAMEAVLATELIQVAELILITKPIRAKRPMPLIEPMQVMEAIFGTTDEANEAGVDNRAYADGRVNLDDATDAGNETNVCRRWSS